MKNIVSLSCASILVSLCSVYGFPTEANEPGKMSSGWGSGSGWVAPTNGTTIGAGQTLVATDVAGQMYSNDDVGGAISSDDGTFTANQTLSNTLFGDLYTDGTYTGLFLGPFVGANFTEVEAGSDNYLQTLANATSFDAATYSEAPYNNATFSLGGFIGSNWATITDGSNVSGGGGGGGWGSGGSGWKQEEAVKLD